MKLFTPSSAKIEHGNKRDQDIAQIAYLTITLDKLQKRINIEQTNFDARMKEQRALYTEEKSKLQHEIKEKQEIVDKLEKRREQALIPVKQLKQQEEAILKEIEALQKSLTEKELTVDEMRENLSDKMDELSEREIQIIENELKIESRLKGIEEETEMISKTHARLNTQVSEFRKEVEVKTKEISEREESLRIREVRNKEYIESRTKQLDEMERGLKDRREALDREFNRLKKK